MKPLLTIALAVLLTASAYADSFTYSFAFNPIAADPNNHQIVTGSFDGTSDGQFVTDITNITVQLAGIQSPGQATVSFTPSPGSTKTDYMGSDYRVSFDGAQNHFQFSAGIPYVTDDWWYFNMGTGNANAWACVDNALAHQIGSPTFYQGYFADFSQWTLTDLSTAQEFSVFALAAPQSVPDTGPSLAAIALLFAGMAVAQKRRVA